MGFGLAFHAHYGKENASATVPVSWEDTGMTPEDVDAFDIRGRELAEFRRNLVGPEYLESLGVTALNGADIDTSNQSGELNG